LRKREAASMAVWFPSWEHKFMLCREEASNVG